MPGDGRFVKNFVIRITVFYDVMLHRCATTHSRVLWTKKLGLLDPWVCKQFIPSKCQEPLTQWRSVTSQKTGILSYTAMETSTLKFL